VIVTIDTDSKMPVYEQLESQIHRLIASGELQAGTKLPTIRRLAKDLGVATATISRVYEHLANDGWVLANGRKGTTVNGSFPNIDFEQIITNEFVETISKAKQLGMTDQKIFELIKTQLE